MTDRETDAILATETAQFRIGRKVHGQLDERGQFVPYPDDYVIGVDPGATERSAMVIAAIDRERGIVTVESLEDVITRLADRVEAAGGKRSHIFVSPANHLLVIALHRKWRRREMRSARMARKRRRGWA